MNPGSVAIVRAQRMAEIVELPVEDAGTDSEAIRIKRDLAREIHDQVAQHLTAILMQSQVCIREQEPVSALS